MDEAAGSSLVVPIFVANAVILAGLLYLYRARYQRQQAPPAAAAAAGDETKSMGASCSSSNDNVEPFTPRPDGDGNGDVFEKALSVTPGSSTASAETGNGSGSGSGSGNGNGNGNVNSSDNGRGSGSGNVSDDTAIPGLVQVTSAPTALRLAFPSGSAGGGETERKSEKLTRFKDVCSEILPYLFVSGVSVTSNRPLLEKHGITHILNCAGDVIPNSFPDQFQYTTLHLYDDKMEPIQCLFPTVIDLIERVRRDGGRLLVHCTQGVSRSCTFCIAYLMWKNSTPFPSVYEFVRGLRGIASPNLGFTCQLAAWGQGLTAWWQPRSVSRCMVYETIPHPNLFRATQPITIETLQKNLLPFAVHDGPGRVGGVPTRGRGGVGGAGEKDEDDDLLESRAASAAPLHGRGCFLIAAQNAETDVRFWIWVGSECKGALRDAMIAATKRTALLLAAQEGSATPRTIAGDAGEKVAACEVVDQGFEPPQFWEALIGDKSPAPVISMSRSDDHAVYTLLPAVEPAVVDSFYATFAAKGDGATCTFGRRRSPRRSPRASPRSSPRSSPRASPRTPRTPRSGSKLTPRTTPRSIGGNNDDSTAKDDRAEGDVSDGDGGTVPEDTTGELLQFTDNAWEKLGGYDDDDLDEDGFFVLSCWTPSTSTITAFTWTGSTCNVDPPAAQEVKELLAAGKLPTKSPSPMPDGVTVNVDEITGGEETEDFWEWFESGY